MEKVSTALKHPFLMAIIPAFIGLGGTVYLSDKGKTVDEAEKIYWQSIQPPNDSDEKYCAYLTKYPHGNFIEIAETQCSTALEAKEKAADLAEEKAAQAQQAAEIAEAKAKDAAEKAEEVAQQQAEVEEELKAEEREAMTKGSQ